MDGDQFTIQAEAFSRTAEKYDSFAEDHPHLTRMRNKVYAHLTRHLEPGANILELNSGSGTDAVYLAQHGFQVHATDIAPGMLQRLQNKVENFGLGDRLTYQELSFTNMEQVQGGDYDALFSNLGGLNCIPELGVVIRKIPEVLRPGGLITWVLMPNVCLWELAMLFTGKVGFALRRFSRNGKISHLEGLHFMVYYFSPHKVVEAFGTKFNLVEIEGLSVITPTAESKNFAKRFPRLYRTLSWLDDRVSRMSPWWGWGDFFIITLRYEP